MISPQLYGDSEGALGGLKAGYPVLRIVGSFKQRQICKSRCLSVSVVARFEPQNIRQLCPDPERLKKGKSLFYDRSAALV